MDISEQIKNLINAAGVLAEMTKVQYDAMINAGFDDGKALYLSAEFMKKLLEMSRDNEKRD